MIGRPPLSRLQPPRLAHILCRTQDATVFYRLPPLRYRPRTFTSSSIRPDDGPINHYEVLRLSPNVTKAELKKQFYTLSKETHPDRHPNDPKAGERFSQISESYSILADDEKRRRYDRDFFRQQGGDRGSNGPASYAGSRPASGLSKRRGTFRGPPPSFYAQGGYGTSSRPSPETEQRNAEQNYAGGTFNAGAYSDRPNTEFNPRPIHRTQSAEDQRRLQRRAAQIQAMQAEVDAMTDSGFWGRFVVVSAIVFLGVTIGSIVVSRGEHSKGGLLRADGSKRGERSNDWAKG